jgi:manganese transport protein
MQTAVAAARPTALVNLVVNMSQMSAMIEGAYGAFGMLPPAVANPPLVAATVALTAVALFAAVLGGYKRIEKIMTALLLVILVCFIVVAIKGLLDWHTWVSLAGGLVPQVPADVVVAGSDRTRAGFTQIMAIAGQGLAPAVFLSYGYLASNAGYTAADVRPTFWKTVRNLGVIWGIFRSLS